MSAPPKPANGGKYDYLIVGAGFAGSVLAERLATQHKVPVNADQAAVLKYRVRVTY